MRVRGIGWVGVLFLASASCDAPRFLGEPSGTGGAALGPTSATMASSGGSGGAASASTSSSAAAGGNGGGACVHDADCPSMSDCVVGTCDEGGQCGTKPATIGTACFEGGVVCDGAGTCVGCNVDADCPAVGTCATASSCSTSKTCDVDAASIGTACTEDGGNQCDGQGYCLGALTVLASVGAGWTCAQTTVRGVKCWGENGSGQLGNGTLTPSLLPQDVTPLTHGVTSIAVGSGFGCASVDSGSVYCWGGNARGQLGDGTSTNSLVPLRVPGINDALAVTAGESFACALTISGGAKCWGDNTFGQLGVGLVTTSTPVAVQDLTDVSVLSAGSQHVCAMTTAGTVKCWGNGAHGALGNGQLAGTSSLPVDVIGLDGLQARQLGSGNQFSCAVIMGASAECWGFNLNGQLGDGTTNDSGTPLVVATLPRAAQVGCGSGFACAQTLDGPYCWGENHRGTLGNGTTKDSLSPVHLTLSAGATRSITAGETHACVATKKNALYCWGNNDDGQLGDGTTMQRSVPTAVTGL